MSIKKKLIFGGIACVLLVVLLTIICLPFKFAKDENKFVYELKNDCYVVKDIKNAYRDGWFSKEKLVVPATYKNKKVVTLEKIEAGSLRELVISEGIENISDNALVYNVGMTKVTLPDSLKKIGAGAFANTAITGINIPKNVAVIGEGAFSGCNKLDSMTVAEDNSVFHGSGNCIIATASKTLVSGCSISVIPTDGSVTAIGNSAFKSCSGLTDVTLPDSVTSIGNKAFSDCTGLTNITLPANATSLGSSAFSGCNKLTNITIPTGVTSIGNSAFNACTALETVNWNATACTTAGNDRSPIFESCGKLTTITLGNNVTTIPDYAFYKCNQITAMALPDNLTSIGNSAFNGCNKLTAITIPDSVTGIGSNAFNGCSKLTQINYGGTSTQWESVVKGDNWDKGTGSYTVQYAGDSTT